MCESIDGLHPISVFERAADAIGTDFLANPFWDQYILFEEDRKRPENVLKILERVIRIPLSEFVRFFEKYFVLAPTPPIRYGFVSVTRPISELISPQQEADFRAEINIQGSHEKNSQEVETEVPPTHPANKKSTSCDSRFII